GERDLVLRRVLARGLTERLARFLNVQNVVHDLEGETDVLAVTGERLILRGGRARVDRAHAQAGAQQRSGLRAVNRLQQLRIRRLDLAFEGPHLPAAHSAPGA